MLKEMLSQNFVFIESQLTELDNSAFVTMLTNLPWIQRSAQLQFRSLDPYIRPRLHITRST